jgi:putative hemolysin
MEIAVEIVVILLLMVLNGVFAMGEMSLVSVRRARLQVLEGKGVAGARTALALSDDPQRFLPTVQVGITLVSILAGVFGGARLAAQLEPWLARIAVLRPVADGLSLFLVVVLITYLTLVVGELVPKQLALRQPERVAARLARPLAALARASAPVVWVLSRSSDLVLAAFGSKLAARETVTEEELKAILAEGAQTGVLETEEHAMIGRVLRLADKPVRALMTPRTDLAWIDRGDTADEIVATLRAVAHSRFVVCDGSIDNVVGVVQAKDLLNLLLDGRALSLAAVLRQPMVLPDTVTALDALERLKSDTLGLALVIDEYGSFEGVVTAADVLEAIVGDAGERPEDGDAAAVLSGVLLMDGMMPVDELKSRLSLPDLPAEGSYHTLGGLLLALLQRVPRAGDRIAFAGWMFEVLAMDGRRVDRVRASRERLAEA